MTGTPHHRGDAPFNQASRRYVIPLPAGPAQPAGGGEGITPAVWPLEVANALLVAERRKRITVAQVTALLGRIAQLPISVEPVEPDRAFSQILSVARQQELTEYDAAYVELALRAAFPLAALDDKLRRAARRAWIGLASL